MGVRFDVHFGGAIETVDATAQVDIFQKAGWPIEGRRPPLANSDLRLVSTVWEYLRVWVVAALQKDADACRFHADSRRLLEERKVDEKCHFLINSDW